MKEKKKITRGQKNIYVTRKKKKKKKKHLSNISITKHNSDYNYP